MHPVGEGGVCNAELDSVALNNDMSAEAYNVENLRQIRSIDIVAVMKSG